eukprot:15365169-Ditylum_brightwellii.AAC.1
MDAELETSHWQRHQWAQHGAIVRHHQLLSLPLTIKSLQPYSHPPPPPLDTQASPSLAPALGHTKQNLCGVCRKYWRASSLLFLGTTELFFGKTGLVAEGLSLAGLLVDLSEFVTTQQEMSLTFTTGLHRHWQHFADINRTFCNTTGFCRLQQGLLQLNTAFCCSTKIAAGLVGLCTLLYNVSCRIRSCKSFHSNPIKPDHPKRLD